MNYPTSLDDTSSLPNPGATDKTNSPSHAGLHSDENAAIIALETKMGTGSSTPVANRLLYGDGTGTSSWTQLTSAQLAATITDETGTGSVVFQSSPTLNTPKVDTIQENTAANGVTVDGLNIKDGELNTNNSVVTANITDGSVTNAKLAINAAYTTYIPTIGTGSLGNGTITGRYQQVGKTIFFDILFNLGSTSSAPGGTTFTLPVTALTTAMPVAANAFFALGGFYDSSASTNYSITPRLESSTTVRPLYWSTSTAGTGTGSPPTTPATNDALFIHGFYEAA